MEQMVLYNKKNYLVLENNGVMSVYRLVSDWNEYIHPSKRLFCFDLNWVPNTLCIHDLPNSDKDTLSIIFQNHQDLIFDEYDRNFVRKTCHTVDDVNISVIGVLYPNTKIVSHAGVYYTIQK